MKNYTMIMSIHYYPDKFIQEEILHMYQILSELLEKKTITNEYIYTFEHIISRMQSITDFYSDMEKDINKPKVRIEYPHYKIENNIVKQLNCVELCAIYKEEKKKWENFIKDSNTKSLQYVKETLIILTHDLGANDTSKIWEGLYARGNKGKDDIMIWKSNNSARYNQEKCIRYLNNVIKHCFSYERILCKDFKGQLYLRMYFSHIVKILMESLGTIYQINEDTDN